MPSRRDFVKTMVAATTGACVAGCGFKARAQARRQVMVGGRPATVVDIHAHCVWPQVAEVIRGTRFDRNFPEFQILGPERIEEMDVRGVDIQVLTVNKFWWYAADRDLATRIVSIHDRELAAWCEKHPDRFVAMSSVALQYPELAAEQLEYAVSQLGFRGASIGGHVEGVVPSSTRFDVFWAKAEELGVPIFMHPSRAENVVKEDAFEGRGDLGNIIGNPLETTVFLSRMIYDGTLDRFPGLKICAAHGGGYMPSYLGRSEVACEVRDDANCANAKSPSEYLRSQILVDSMVFLEEDLRHLVAEVGASQVVYGSDLPFNWPDTIDLIVESPYLNDADKRSILGGNLIGLLGIKT